MVAITKRSCVLVIVAILATVMRKPLLHNRVMKGTAPWALAEQNFAHDQIPNLTGKLVIVTGANVGLGKSTSKFFALNGAKTIMTCRTAAKGKSARSQIVAELLAEGRVTEPEADRVMALLVPMELELGSLSSVKAFADKFMADFGDQGLNSLVLNAGIMHTPVAADK